MARLQELYKQTVIPGLMDKFGYKNVMQVPRITKIILNMGVGEAMADKKIIENAMSDMLLIGGQKPAMTRAHKSVAAFKVRQNWPIGCKVTLRGVRMYEFLDRLISVAIPRTRDFRGLPSRSFDGNGNYSFGIKEQIIFPEIDFDKVDAIRGMDITIVTSTDNDDEARALLEAFNFPMRTDAQVSREAGSRERPMRTDAQVSREPPPHPPGTQTSQGRQTPHAGSQKQPMKS